MKPFPTTLFAVLLATSALADDPAPPSGPDWKSWDAACADAKERLGYVMMFITPAPKDGKEAPYTTRVLHELNNPAFYAELNLQYGCWKGTWAAASRVAGKALAGVTCKEVPAFVFFDPETGDVVDCLPGHAACGELRHVLDAIKNGRHLKGLREKLKDKEFRERAELQLAFGEALVRAGDARAAREALALALKSSDQKERFFAKAALLRCDMLEDKWDDAIKHADELIPLLPPEGNELKAEAKYIQMWAYFRLGKLDDCSKVALDLRENLRRAPFGVKSVTDVEDFGFDFILKEKVASAK